MRIKKFNILVCAAFIASLLLAGCGSSSKTATRTPARKPRAPRAPRPKVTDEKKEDTKPAAPEKKFTGYPDLINDLNFTEDMLTEKTYDPTMHAQNVFKDFKKNAEMKKKVRDIMKEVKNAQNNILSKVSKMEEAKMTIRADVTEWLKESDSFIEEVEKAQKYENFLKAMVYAEKALVSIRDVVKKIDNYSISEDTLTEFTYRGFYSVGSDIKGIIQKTLLKASPTVKTAGGTDVAETKTDEKGDQEKKLEQESKMEVINQEIILVMNGDLIEKDNQKFKVKEIAPLHIKFVETASAEEWVLYLESEKK